MELLVTIQVNNQDIPVGKLYSECKRGVESSSFRYDSSYLENKNAFPLAPDMPLTATTLHVSGMFGVFEDAMPDRWGRNLLARAEARRAFVEKSTPRTLCNADYLSGVADETRQGALRFWVNGKPVAPLKTGVPKEVYIPQLLEESYLVESNNLSDINEDIHDLISAGSSLGGARPKASVIDEQNILMVAKFPKKEENSINDTCAWENAALILARNIGIEVPRTRLIRVRNKAVLLLERFDRKAQGARIPYMSAMTAIGGTDGGNYSYLQIVDFLERFGACPGKDIPQLWLRILFSVLIGNTDDHMRNHGFLWNGKGWVLSPAFDINPTPGSGIKFLSNAIDIEDTSASVETVIRCAEYYRVNSVQANEQLKIAREVLSHWQKVAKSCGISEASVARMRSCFEPS